MKKLAALARISVPDSELAAFSGEFDAILKYVGQLDELEVKKGEPIVPYTNIFRADENPHEPGMYTEKIVEQFPVREGDLLSVKQIISHD
ncbi:MAG: Asp-tRNA(Asn)/Glu-tRNA(Gln) amidotransferase subunit GatB [Candidatus Pacebacteria bacterium]|nr:Asp-tRNA(Asn)/Glu-tRNA(Gln) amidotransferase subunit GatB [Candidatus Paceibacterota bacterium]